MLHDTPFRDRHTAEAERLRAERAPREGAERPGAATGSFESTSGPEYIPWGPPDSQGDVACEILSTLGTVELEYAHLRRDCGRFDDASRGTILVEGGDAVDFLDRMLSQKLSDLGPGRAAKAFLVNRTGRLQADLLLVGMDAGVLVDVDVHQVASTIEILQGFLFAEDVSIRDASNEWHRFGVHGPESPSLFPPLEPLQSTATDLGGVEVHVVRCDRIGEPGFDVFVRWDDAVTAWDALGCGTVGWYAYNMARIEGGTALCNIDFGPGMLPHETGVVHERVSFNKGCYPGQEIVARLEHLGKPKQVLRGLRMQGDALPVAGAQVFPSGEETLGDPIGVVTSSCLSPMLGSSSIGFAMLRTAVSEPGTVVRVHDEGAPCDAMTGALEFLSPGTEVDS